MRDRRLRIGITIRLLFPFLACDLSFMKSALQATHPSFVFSPRYGVWPVLKVNTPQGAQLSFAFIVSFAPFMGRGPGLTKILMS